MTTPWACAVMKPFSSTDWVAPTRRTVRPALCNNWFRVSSAGLPSGCTPLSSIVAGCPATCTPCTVVDDVPTGCAPLAYRDSAIEVIESIVSRPPAIRIPGTIASECDTAVDPSKRLAVVDCAEPVLNNVVSTGAPGVGVAPGSGSAGGSGMPVVPPPGMGALRTDPICAVVDDVPASWLMIARASAASPDNWPCGSPYWRPTSVWLSGVKPSACAVYGHFVLTHASTNGWNCSAPGKPLSAMDPTISGHACAGPCVAPLPGSATDARAAGPLDELIDDEPDTNCMWKVSLMGVRPPS